ncbi:MAG TPA: DUF2892 domain-containing protein [Fimbriimonadaceae bacterium]|nr:DUF2892 domain-containing protein [Fimbriimonadaceae bacterium]
MRKSVWTVERQVRLTVGILVLTSVALAYFVNIAWLFMTTFIGFGLVFAGFTSVCPMEGLISRCPWNRTKATPAHQS